MEKSSSTQIKDFTAIYDLYHDAIFRYCFWKCRDRDLAEDLVQDTFLRFCVCVQKKQAILHTRAFLYRIAHNLFINHVRKKKEQSLDQLVETGYEPVIDLWHETVSRLDAEKPLKTLDAMSKPFKQVLHHRFVRGLLPAEIATITGESANVVSVRIFRGLKHLRVLLQNRQPVLYEALA